MTCICVTAVILLNIFSEYLLFPNKGSSSRTKDLRNIAVATFYSISGNNHHSSKMGRSLKAQCAHYWKCHVLYRFIYL